MHHAPFDIRSDSAFCFLSNKIATFNHRWLFKGLDLIMGSDRSRDNAARCGEICYVCLMQKQLHRQIGKLLIVFTLKCITVKNVSRCQSMLDSNMTKHTSTRWRLTDCDFSTRSHLWIISMKFIDCYR